MTAQSSARHAANAIRRKRSGEALEAEEIRAIVDGQMSRRIDGSQLTDFLHAVAAHGMTVDETLWLTIAIRDSGETVAWPDNGRPVVDRHSTGGVGDPSTLIVVPLMASLGARSPSLSTPGAGIFGGTVDKIASIPGVQVCLPPRRLVDVVQEAGCAISGTTEGLAPADGALFTLRANSGTLACIPLIVSSILSKKAAAGVQVLAIDVKYGSRMLLRDYASADAFERSTRAVAARLGIRLVALLSPESAPASSAVGNWLEVMQANDYLAGGGPAALRARVSATAASLAVSAGLATDQKEADEMVATAIESGAALSTWRGMLASQGADLTAFDHKLDDRESGSIEDLAAWSDGFVDRCDAATFGACARALAHDEPAGDRGIDTGIDEIRLPGESCRVGDSLARVHAATRREALRACRDLEAAFLIADQPPRPERIEVRLGQAPEPS